MLNLIGSRLHNFVIGITDMVPSVAEPPALGLYAICAIYIGVAAEGQTVSLTCRSGTPPGRYVVVQMPFSFDSITLCEVQVFVDLNSTGKTPTGEQNNSLE